MHARGQNSLYDCQAFNLEFLSFADFKQGGAKAPLPKRLQSALRFRLKHCRNDECKHGQNDKEKLRGSSLAFC